jgi:type I restriction enzyme S subunit
MSTKISVFFEELKDNWLVPFYLFEKKIQQFPLTLGSLINELANGIDLRNFAKEGTPYFRITDVKRNQTNILTVKKVSKYIKDIPSRILIRRGDILITRKGTPGISTLATEIEESGIIGTEIIKVSLKSNTEISPEVLVCFLNTKIGFAQLLSKITGAVSRGITHSALKSVKIPHIPKDMQFEIIEKVKRYSKAHILSLQKIDKARKILEQEINIRCHHIKEEKIYSINSEDLSDILLPKFYYPKYLNTLKLLRKKFETLKIGDVADIKRGDEVGSKNYRKYVDKRDSDVPFIRTSDLVNYEIDNYPDYYIDKEIYRELNQDLKEGDLLVSNDGKIGLLAILTKEDKCIIQSHIRRVRFFDRIDSYYALAFLFTDFGQFQFNQFTFTQATIPTISDRLAEIEIPLIDSEKQKKISNLVKEAFELKSKKKRLIKEAINQVENLLK